MKQNKDKCKINLRDNVFITIREGVKKGFRKKVFFGSIIETNARNIKVRMLSPLGIVYKEIPIRQVKKIAAKKCIEETYEKNWKCI